MPTTPRGQAACPRCSATVKLHPSTNRISEHRIRAEKGAPRCTFGGDYLPGFVPETPIRDRREKSAA